MKHNLFSLIAILALLVPAGGMPVTARSRRGLPRRLHPRRSYLPRFSVCGGCARTVICWAADFWAAFCEQT